MGDREFMRDAVRRRAVSLCFTTPELRVDKYLVLEAVRSDGLALHYAAEELRVDHEFLVQATREAACATEASVNLNTSSAPSPLSRTVTLNKTFSRISHKHSFQ